MPRLYASTTPVNKGFDHSWILPSLTGQGINLRLILTKLLKLAAVQ